MPQAKLICGWVFLFIFVLGLPQHLRAEKTEVQNESLKLTPLIQEALQNNPELVAATSQVEAFREQIPQSRSLDDPQLTFRLWNTPASLNVTRSERTIYGFGQRFPFPGTLSEQERIAVKLAEQAEQRFEGKKREIIERVKVAYYELAYIHQAIAIHHEQAKRLRRFFLTAKAKFRTGKRTQVDVLKAQVQLSKWFQHLPILEQQQQSAQARLNTILNRNPEAPLARPDKPTDDPRNLSLAELQQQALVSRPEIRESMLAIEQHERAIKLAELQTYPQLNVEVQRWQNRQDDDGFGGIISLNLPFAFWTKPKYEAGVREAIAQREAALFKKKTIENLTRFQIRDLVARIQAKENIFTLYTTTVLPQARHTLKAAIAGYRTDRVDFLDLIEADQALISYELEYVRALVDWNQLLAKIERVVGRDL